MKKQLPIYVERLRDGESEEIFETIDPKELSLADNEITANMPVEVRGEAYLADPFFLVQLTISTTLELACSVCNESFQFPVEIANFTHEEPIENIRDMVFDLMPVIREAVLLEVPFYPLCGKTMCLNRESVEKYIKKGDAPPETGYKPFENL